MAMIYIVLQMGRMLQQIGSRWELMAFYHQTIRTGFLPALGLGAVLSVHICSSTLDVSAHLI